MNTVDNKALWYVPAAQADKILALAPGLAVPGNHDTTDAAVTTILELAGKLGADTRSAAITTAKADYDESLARAGTAAKASGLQVAIMSPSTDSLYVADPNFLPEGNTVKKAGLDMMSPPVTTTPGRGPSTGSRPTSAGCCGRFPGRSCWSGTVGVDRSSGWPLRTGKRTCASSSSWTLRTNGTTISSCRRRPAGCGWRARSPVPRQGLAFIDLPLESGAHCRRNCSTGPTSSSPRSSRGSPRPRITLVTGLLLEKLHRAGMRDVVRVDEVTGGLAAVAGVAERRNAPPIFVKSFEEEPVDDVFAAEAEGLTALRELGAMATPEVILANRELLCLSMLRPRPDDERFWEQFAHELAHMHSKTYSQYGWHNDNWLGRRPQINTWGDDGFTFFAEHRLLRWLGEPRVDAALDAGDRAALERLCARLPELLPKRPPCLTHGDLWTQNVMATPDGRPALIDPAVSYMWAEVDLAHLWTTSPPPEASRFFDVYAELTGLDAGWRERMPIIQLRQHLAVLAQFDPDWGAADTIRTTLDPFRRP